MEWHEEIASRVDAYLGATGMNPNKLGLLAAGNARALERLRAGVGTLSTVRKIEAFMRRYPDGKNVGDGV